MNAYNPLRSILFVIISTWCFASYAQFQFIYNDSLPIIKLGNTLKYPWAGGLNFSQFSELDFDYDGDLDLVVLDRSNDQIRLFEHVVQGANHSYLFNHFGESYFPSDVRYRLFLADYNLDGKNDIFTYGIGGVKVYRNSGDASIGLQWTLEKNLLYSDYNGLNMGLYVSSADIPAIVDVDGDLDLDILTFSIAGDHVEYHKNMSKELFGHCDSLIYVLKNKCWGGFREEVTSNAITLFDNSTLCTTGNVPNPELPVILKPEAEEKAHSGSTLLALDMDQSGVLDALIGDVAYGNLNFLTNSGNLPNTNSLMNAVDPAFPSNSIPLNLQIFPGAFYLDVDFDGKKDLICSPNAKGTSENEKSIWKYKNQGTASLPIFVFETDAFLQKDMIEHGIGSVPVFADVTNDGLVDMFVANYFAYKPTLQQETRIAYYKNTGTASNPVFTFIDDDFLNLSQLNAGLRIIPTFGDLNADNQPELILGMEDGTLRYYPNVSTGSSPLFGAPQTAYQGIDVGQLAAPQLFDMDKDNLLDILIGEKTGTIKYYRNTGTAAAPVFALINTALGGIDIETATPDGFPIPHFFRWQDTSYLLVGGYDGKIRFYDSIDNHLLDTFHLRAFPFLGIEVGAFSAPYVVDADQDGNLDLYIGQDLGGIFRLEHQTGSNLALSENQIGYIRWFPNPCNDNVSFESQDPIGALTFYSVAGQHVKTIILEENNVSLDMRDFQKGCYFVFRNSKPLGRIIKN